ncbi:radical SAM protein [Caloranaerobacter azorensis]|uniref:Radical SAM protein n=1 Tax=Caloranaerobacter azorensis TaxID=116090 RepID=A0A6P1YFH4_9FIRM|nr:radical SAM protein [Caloranaerobacter azorensis]QIB27488.1 radical SAM protein [Caloranaerobacter azorensis]
MNSYIGVKENVKVFFYQDRIIIKNIYSDAYFIVGKEVGFILYLISKNKRIDELIENIGYLYDIPVSKAKDILFKTIELLKDYIEISDKEFKRGEILLDFEDLKLCRTFKDLKQKSEYPTEIVLYLTKHCIRNCLYCKEKAVTDNGIEKDNFFLDIDRLEALVNEQRNVTDWVLTGGEPLLHPNIIQISRLIKRRSNAKLSIATKGVPDLQIIKLLCDESLIDCFCFSLDSIQPDTVNYLSGSETTFSDISNCIKLVKDAGIEININTVLTTKNYLQINDIVEFCKTNQIPKINFLVAEEKGRCRDFLLLNNEQILFCKETIKELAIRYHQYTMPVLKVKDKFNNCYNCSNLYNRLIIKYDGSVELCNGKYLGNLDGNTIKNVWDKFAL